MSELTRPLKVRFQSQVFSAPYSLPLDELGYVWPKKPAHLAGNTSHGVEREDARRPLRTTACHCLTAIVYRSRHSPSFGRDVSYPIANATRSELALGSEQWIRS
jgi:hypothetical protein